MDDSLGKALVNGGVIRPCDVLTGMYPRTVNRMLMRKSALQPRSRKTPRGGRKMARMILQISLVVVSGGHARHPKVGV